MYKRAATVSMTSGSFGQISQADSHPLPSMVGHYIPRADYHPPLCSMVISTEQMYIGEPSGANAMSSESVSVECEQAMATSNHPDQACKIETSTLALPHWKSQLFLSDNDDVNVF